MPVSNHGARIRLIIKAKNLQDVAVKPPESIGGLKGDAFLKLNPLGKMPVLITESQDVIFESDVIARYLVDKYRDASPSFIPKTIEQRTLSDTIVRLHDVYISSLQGSMYKVQPFPFSVFGNNRKMALNELLKQVKLIEDTVTAFDKKYYHLYSKKNIDNKSLFLAGDDISLADVTLYPTAIFFKFILPEYFGITDFFGERLNNWYAFMDNESKSNKDLLFVNEVKAEVMSGLNSWKIANRFGPIVEEMKTY